MIFLDWIKANLERILLFAAVLVAGFVLIKMITKILANALKKKEADSAISGFIVQLLRILLYIVYVISLCAMLGIPTTSIIALFSAGALAVSLALQNSLTNLASGFIIIYNRPFKAGDFIEVDGVSGSVTAINMMTTVITTPDNKIITLPNNTIVNSHIINYSSMTDRRIDFTFRVAHGSDVERAKSMLRVVFENMDGVNLEKAVTVRLSAIGESSLEIVVRGWVANSKYWNVYYDMLEAGHQVLVSQGFDVPAPRLDVNITK